MGNARRALGRAGLAVAGTAATLTLVIAGHASAFQPLPAGVQVNDDPPAGINPALGLSGEDPTNADVVGGALAAGKVAVPWAIFQQHTATKDQVFSRSFAAGAWTTRGSGTVGGRSSASPIFSGSLNFDQTTDGEVPSIDFAGAGRTVPWATWYEDTSGAGFGGKPNVFASRFDNTGDANQGKWIFGGQGRGSGGGSVPVPSLNIHTDQDAENPSVAGGSVSDSTKPGPWVTWQETAPGSGKDQIFVERPMGPAMANCDGVTPLGVVVGSDIPAVGGFCWQQTGIERIPVGTPTDPTLNVDPTRNGIEPDIAFTGPSDSVPWVVWYETGTSTANPPLNNELVFAAKGTANPAADGGIQWTAVGNQLSGVLDTTGANSFGTCGTSQTNESQCSLNSNTANDAEDPRVAAGTMNPANPTVPWVAWDEGPHNGTTQVFVSRLVTTPTPHFALANNGQPISTGSGSAGRPDITFSHNTPYVTWHQDVGGGAEHAFVGHFVNAANPTFVLDESDVTVSPTTPDDVREPISSSCTANPFNGDGAACQGGAVGTPFFLFSSGSSPAGLFADAYAPTVPVTGAATAVTETSATLGASVNPSGAPTTVLFQFGTTTAYGSTTAPQTLGADNTPDGVTAALAGLPTGTLVHYRAVATTDLGTFIGADQSFTTASPPPPNPTPKAGIASAGRTTVKGETATVPITCAGGTSCRVTVALTVHETVRGRKIIAVTARKVVRTKHKLVVIGRVTMTVAAGKTAKVTVKLNAAGRGLVNARRRLTTTLTATQTVNGKTRKLLQRKVKLVAPAKRRHRA